MSKRSRPRTSESRPATESKTPPTLVDSALAEDAEDDLEAEWAERLAQKRASAAPKTSDKANPAAGAKSFVADGAQSLSAREDAPAKPKATPVVESFDTSGNSKAVEKAFASLEARVARYRAKCGVFYTSKSKGRAHAPAGELVDPTPASLESMLALGSIEEV